MNTITTNNMLIIGAQLESYRSLKDRTLKLTFETGEPTPDQLVKISKLSQEYGFLAFKHDVFKNDQLDALESLQSGYEDKGKSKSQRLRAVLYVNWKQESKGYDIFDDYYNHTMEKIITHYKGKLD